MAAVLPLLPETARKINATILHQLASVGQTKVAEVLGVSESTVSRMKEKELPEIALLLDALGLKAVPRAHRCYDEKSLAAIIELAKQRMAQIDEPQHLAWGDEAATA